MPMMSEMTLKTVKVFPTYSSILPNKFWFQLLTPELNIAALRYLAAKRKAAIKQNPTPAALLPTFFSIFKILLKLFGNFHLQLVISFGRLVADFRIRLQLKIDFVLIKTVLSISTNLFHKLISLKFWLCFLTIITSRSEEGRQPKAQFSAWPLVQVKN